MDEPEKQLTPEEVLVLLRRMNRVSRIRLWLMLAVAPVVILGILQTLLDLILGPL